MRKTTQAHRAHVSEHVILRDDAGRRIGVELGRNERRRLFTLNAVDGVHGFGLRGQRDWALQFFQIARNFHFKGLIEMMRRKRISLQEIFHHFTLGLQVSDVSLSLLQEEVGLARRHLVGVLEAHRPLSQ